MKELDLDALRSIPDPLGATPRAPKLAAVSGEAPRPAAGPTRSVLRRRRTLVVALGLAWLFAIQLVIGIRGDVPFALMFLHVAVPSLLGAGALWLALDPGRAGVGPTIRSTSIFAVVASVVFAASMLLGPAVLGDAGVVQGEDSSNFFEKAFLCGDFILALAVVPLIGLAWVQRRTAPSSAGIKSALFGVAAGFTAGGLQALHCAHSDAPHVVLGHGWPVLVMGLVAWIAFRKTVRA